MRPLAAFAFAFLVACPPKHVEPRPAPSDPAEVLARARANPLAGTVVGQFDVKLATPTERVSAQGSLLVDPAGRFRLELRGPIGGPALVVASDGTGLWAWQAGPNVFWEAPAADAAVREATGGQVGLGPLVVALAGRLPDLGAPDAVAVDVDGWPTYTWSGQDGGQLVVRLDPDSTGLRGLAVRDPSGRVWLDATFDPGKVPEALRVQLPVQGVEADLDFGAWGNANPDPSVYTLTAPPGAEVKTLELTRRPGDEPQP